MKLYIGFGAGFLVAMLLFLSIGTSTIEGMDKKDQVIVVIGFMVLWFSGYSALKIREAQQSLLRSRRLKLTHS